MIHWHALWVINKPIDLYSEWNFHRVQSTIVRQSNAIQKCMISYLLLILFNKSSIAMTTICWHMHVVCHSWQLYICNVPWKSAQIEFWTWWWMSLSHLFCYWNWVRAFWMPYTIDLEWLEPLNSELFRFYDSQWTARIVSFTVKMIWFMRITSLQC